MRHILCPATPLMAAHAAQDPEVLRRAAATLERLADDLTRNAQRLNRRTAESVEHWKAPAADNHRRAIRDETLNAIRIAGEFRDAASALERQARQAEDEGTLMGRIDRLLS